MEVTPVPIPNTEVKLHSADDTWRATAWESRTLLVCLMKLHNGVAFFYYIGNINIKKLKKKAPFQV